MDPNELRDLVRHEIRQHNSRIARRYLPAAMAAVALILLVLLVPDKNPDSGSTFGDSGLSGSTLPNSVTGSNGGSTPGTTTGGSSPSLGGTTSNNSGGVGSNATGSSSTPGFGGNSSTTTTNDNTGTTSSKGSGGKSGKSKGGGSKTASGPTCGGSSRQFTFSPYAPACVAGFTGNNGGKTAPGVTPTTITIALRQTSDNSAVAAATGAPSFSDTAHDMNVLVNYFNKKYELYGRHVVLKTYNGKGSYLSEAAGSDQNGAASDAQTEVDMGTFADVGQPSVGSYEAALVSHHIVTFSVPTPLSLADSEYPYDYQMLGPVLDYSGFAGASLICDRLANNDASFAGDSTYKLKKRSFALIEPAGYGNSGGSNVVATEAQKLCGVKVVVEQYNTDPATYAQQAVQISAKLKAEGITTVVLATDIVFAPIMTNGAIQSGYSPEWIYDGANSNSAGRQLASQAVAHMIFLFPWAPQSEPLAKDDCYKIFKQAGQGAPESGASIDLYCAELTELFGGLQSAGPDLTPATFGKGWFGQPDSAGSGQFGTWAYGQGQFSPDATFNIEHFVTGGKNPQDGGSGEFKLCSGLTGSYAYLDPKLGSGQLNCFG